MTTDIERLVIRAPNWLGDAVMALPAMGAVRQAFGGAHVAVAAIPSIAPLFEEGTNAGQDNVLIVRDRREESKVLGAGQFDAALLLPNSFRSAAAAWRADIHERWGYAAQLRGWMLSKAVPRPRTALHHSVYYLELVRSLGVPAPSELPWIAVKPGTAARADALLASSGVVDGRRAIGFAPGAAYGHAKRWPPRHVADVIVRLTREHRSMCLPFGPDGDRAPGREIESLLPSAFRRQRSDRAISRRWPPTSPTYASLTNRPGRKAAKRRRSCTGALRSERSSTRRTIAQLRRPQHLMGSRASTLTNN